MKKLLYLVLFVLMFYISTVVYAYDIYKVGDEIEYNNIKFYVIEDSDENSDTVLLLKKDFVTYDELMQLDIENKSQIASYDGDAGFSYGSSTGSYEDSYIKSVVDAWEDKIALNSSDIKEARLIKYEDLINNLGYEENVSCTTSCYYNGSLDNIPDWLKDNESCFFTMSNVDDTQFVWMITIGGSYIQAPGFPCRFKPVIRLYKEALVDIESSPSDDKSIDNKSVDNNKSETTSVPNTGKKISIFFVLISLVVVIIGILLLIKVTLGNSKESRK